MQGWSPLMSAVSAGHEPVVRMLLSLGANVNQATAQGRTSIHYAASKGRTEILRLLLQAGAKVDVVDCTGSQPLHRAAATGHLDTIRCLVEEGKASVDPRDTSQSSPLLLAAISGHQACCIYLAGKGADVEAEDAEGETPLGAAAHHGKLRDVLVGVLSGDMDVDELLGR